MRAAGLQKNRRTDHAHPCPNTKPTGKRPKSLRPTSRLVGIFSSGLCRSAQRHGRSFGQSMPSTKEAFKPLAHTERRPKPPVLSGVSSDTAGEDRERARCVGLDGWMCIHLASKMVKSRATNRTKTGKYGTCPGGSHKTLTEGSSPSLPPTSSCLTVFSVHPPPKLSAKLRQGHDMHGDCIPGLVHIPLQAPRQLLPKLPPAHGDNASASHGKTRKTSPFGVPLLTA